MAKKSICLQYRCKFCFSAYFDPQLIESKEGEDTDTELDGWNYFLPSRKKPVHAVHWWNASSLWWVYSWGKRRKDPDWTGLLVKLLGVKSILPIPVPSKESKECMCPFMFLFFIDLLCMHTHMHATVCAWSEDNLQERRESLSFYLVGPEDRFQVLMLGDKCFYPLSHLTGPL